jgi:hypothetical protein
MNKYVARLHPTLNIVYISDYPGLKKLIDAIRRSYDSEERSPIDPPCISDLQLPVSPDRSHVATPLATTSCSSYQDSWAGSGISSFEKDSQKELDSIVNPALSMFPSRFAPRHSDHISARHGGELDSSFHKNVVSSCRKSWNPRRKSLILSMSYSFFHSTSPPPRSPFLRSEPIYATSNPSLQKFFAFAFT